MFTVRTKEKPINITTFELDVRLDIAAGNLGVEVYTVPGDYTIVSSIESAWTSVANTQAVRVPGGGGVLIAVQDFTTVSMQADELRSFYVTMQGQWLDSKANGLDTRGDVDQDFAAFTLDVGAGLAEYKFPATFDTTVDPKFAGVIHYEETTPVECSDAVTTTQTTIEYKFLVDDDGQDADVLNSDVSDAVDVFIVSELEDNDGYLKEYGSTYRLQQTGTPSSTSGSRQASK
jgi:hypothetical protein